jgi:hypothetical protein
LPSDYSTAIRDQPSRFTAWRLVVSRFAGKLRLQVAALQKNRAAAFHFIQRAIDVTSRKLDAAAAVEDDVRVQSELARIERAVFDAIIQGEAHEVDVLHVVLLQVTGEPGVAAMSVVEKRTVTINVSLGALVKNMSDTAGVE